MSCLVDVSYGGRFSCLLVARLTIVCAVEAQVGYSVVALDAGGFLQTGGNVVRNLAKDGNLALDDLRVAACGHVAGNVGDEAILGPVIKHLLP